MLAIHASISDELPAEKELRLRVRYTSMLLENGDSPSHARSKLVTIYRIDLREADRIIGLACGVQERVAQRATLHRAQRSMWLGGLIGMGGIAATSVTGGGPFMLTWGATMLGALLFARGLASARSGR